ncbi:unnamed protein product [Blepharisma stoltei]|uniref:USP domain-containing protein n=1 Tax=Blepharisma stoltei TaxID=1481888 RepID=A0AAU9IF11_9CILI|nr:unnamed protein product [Blepharisma stoltei]
MILSKIEEEGGSFNIFSIVFHQVFSCLNLHKSTYDDTQTFLIIPPQHKNAQDNYLRNQSYYYRSTQSLFCNDCNRKIDMSIELKGVDWPEYLVLYFPTPPNNIVESLWINNENSYEIYGVICYYQNEGSFHYTAFTKDGNIWNEYNDKYVGTKAIDPHFVNLAFYSKKVVLSQNMIAEKPYQSHFYNS